MRHLAIALSRLAAALAIGLSVPAAAADRPVNRLSETVNHIENRLKARVGVSVTNSGTGWTWQYRADERFPMNSTVKTLVCGATLARSDQGTLSLDEALPIGKKDVLSYAPVTKTRVGLTLSIGDLCLAALDMSDNTAANLLEARVGGPQAVTAFLRSMGDRTTRVDRTEPDLNDFSAGDERDTTTPSAMSATLKALLLGDVLKPESRRQLASWMSHGSVTGKLLRSAAPTSWSISDKSGSGEQSRNIVALLSPPGKAPWIVALYISDARADFSTRDAALKELAGSVMSVVSSR